MSDDDDLARRAQVVQPRQDLAASICALATRLLETDERPRAAIEKLRLADSLALLDRELLYATLAVRSDWTDAWYAWATQNRLRTGAFLFRYESGGWAGYYEASGVALESARFDDPARACAEFIILELEDSGLLDRSRAS